MLVELETEVTVKTRDVVVIGGEIVTGNASPAFGSEPTV